MDTHHLLRLRDELENALREKGRLSWALEEFETAAAAERPEKNLIPKASAGSREAETCLLKTRLF